MFNNTRQTDYSLEYAQARRRQRGQSIVVALLVLLLLGLAGALFVTIIARNLINAAHSNRVQTADNYAAAGITYADAQLTNSIDGADWRPPLQYQLVVPPTEPRELARYNAAIAANGLGTVNPSDPDLEYLQAGFARYNTGAGRYLVRVTYDTVNVSNLALPPGKYLKIEAIGREGVIDPVDPTTYSNNRSSDKTQATLVAYKPIGITDYARFETNPDKRSDIANLGVASEFYSGNTDGGIATPGVFDFSSTASTSAGVTTPPTIVEYPVVTTYGAADAYLKSAGANGTFVPNPNAGSGNAAPTGFTLSQGGGSIHSNMPLRFFGTNLMYLNNAGASAPLFQDTAEIYGDLLLDNYKDANPLFTSVTTATAGQQAALILNPTDLTKLTTTGTYIAPSNATANGGFNTQNGLIRDSSMQNDAAGLPRSITRLDPPLMDSQDSATQMPRYRAIAMNSTPRLNLKNGDGTTYTPVAGAKSPSLYGYGRAIYVNNPSDIQKDSSAIGGGSTLTDEWLNRTTANPSGKDKGGWNGLFYNPPGVNITLGQLITPPANSTTAGVYGIRLVRNNGDQFQNPDGTANGESSMNVSYADLNSEATNTDLNHGTAPDNDIVIYAEGNVRVRGNASPDEATPSAQAANPRTTVTIPRHITIVTNGTAYIEGNLLKGDPDSTISVLAHDYVCVNTTQFLAGTNVENRTDGLQDPGPVSSSSDPKDGGAAAALRLNASASLLQEFNFGLTGSKTTAGYPVPLALYMTAGPAETGSTVVDFDIFNPANASVFPAPNPPGPVPLLQRQFGSLTHLTYDLSALVTQPTNTNPLFNAMGTDIFRLSVSKDTGVNDENGAGQDVALQRVAVLPMDIRIEAVLYAQTGSFFVIPGDWFNLNKNDNLASYLDGFQNGGLGVRPDVAANSTLAVPQPVLSLNRFPMYGQPIDLKITIDGSVSEAHPADIAAQTAWMQKWGWIPQYHGSLVVSSTPESSGHPTLDKGNPPARANMPSIGLQIIYDSQAGYPYNPAPGIGLSPYYLRSDMYGRPLPVAPKLPVSTGLLYSGQSGEAPLLQ